MSYIRNIEDKLDEIWLIIHKWKHTLCPDCGAPMKIVMGYFQKCSEKPDEHLLCDDEFYLRKIKEVIDRCL